MEIMIREFRDQYTRIKTWTFIYISDHEYKTREKECVAETLVIIHCNLVSFSSKSNFLYLVTDVKLFHHPFLH